MMFCKGNIANAFACSQASLTPEEMRKEHSQEPLTQRNQANHNREIKMLQL